MLYFRELGTGEGRPEGEKQGCGGVEEIRQRAREREREAGPSLNAVRLKFHSVEERKGGQGIRRRKHEIEKE